jgi:hypothetical protein
MNVVHGAISRGAGCSTLNRRIQILSMATQLPRKYHHCSAKRSSGNVEFASPRSIACCAQFIIICRRIMKLVNAFKSNAIWTNTPFRFTTITCVKSCTLILCTCPEMKLKSPVGALFDDCYHWPSILNGVIAMSNDDIPTYPVSREKLYEMAWSEPMTSIAKKFEVSSSYLARVYTLLNVPRPSPGYWSKIAAGYAVKIPDCRAMIPKMTRGGIATTLARCR